MLKDRPKRPCPNDARYSSEGPNQIPYKPLELSLLQRLPLIDPINPNEKGLCAPTLLKSIPLAKRINPRLEDRIQDDIDDTSHGLKRFWSEKDREGHASKKRRISPDTPGRPPSVRHPATTNPTINYQQSQREVDSHRKSPGQEWLQGSAMRNGQQVVRELANSLCFTVGRSSSCERQQELLSHVQHIKSLYSSSTVGVGAGSSATILVIPHERQHILYDLHQ